MVRTATAASDGEQNAAFIRPVYKQFTVLPGQVEQAFARCPQGQVAIAGGYEAQAGSYMYITASAPTKAKGGWEVQALVPNKIESPSALPARILIVAWCVPIGRPVVASVVQ